jgi:hypothetical protein
LLSATLAAATGCATTKSKFESIYPGMTSQQVVQVMEAGPSQAKEFPDGSSAWYYGEDRCVLLRDDKVVTKDRTQENETTAIPGLASVRETKKAFCAPAGVAAPTTQKEIDTPFGTVKGDLDTGRIQDRVLGTDKAK